MSVRGKVFLLYKRQMPCMSEKRAFNCTNYNMFLLLQWSALPSLWLFFLHTKYLPFYPVCYIVKIDLTIVYFLISVLIMVCGLLVFPLGLESRFVQHYCDQSSAYQPGACQLGWGFMLGIMGTALAMFCPFLSQYTDMKVHEPAYV